MGRGRGRPRKSVPPPPDRPTQRSPKPRGDGDAIPNPRTAGDANPNHVEINSKSTEKAGEDEPSFQIHEEQSIANKSEEQKDDTQKLWVDVLSGNRNPINGLAMEFVAPKFVNGEVEVEIEAADIESEVKFWQSSLIMYVLGGDLSMNAVKQFMIKTWNFVKLPDMFYNEEGYFILRFHSFKEKDVVLMQGPYTIRNMPMLLRDWKPDFNLKRDMLRTIPIWIKLPQLPLHLWGVKSLSKISSAIGNPLVTDECTAHKFRVSYARILVEMDITQKLPQDITIKDSEGNKLKQVVEYEWKPLFCDKCQKMGHICEKDPPKKLHKQWAPKPLPIQVVKALVTNEQQEASEEDVWTTVQCSGKVKGKGIQAGSSPITVTCSNGFEPLGILNGPLVIHDTGQ
ncbi:unnamed protein product [Trifolium pratense]|uniref:Uncharacterized protein n=1 Tax=Trifolium pratense TaxID=57577 RepID=A0ACB0JBB8_TRIPR|nr:unnamed protein product [Trifolium pratense]